MTSVSYASYLQLDPLLNLQNRLSKPPAHDEMLFIVIHQTYELWFKQMLHESNLLRSALAVDDELMAMHTLRRQCTILKTLVGQVDILETMTPTSFNAFRQFLENSSGFQSHQFRLLEFMMGKRHPQMLKAYPPQTPAREALEAALQQPSLYDDLLHFFSRQGLAVPTAVLERDLRTSAEPSDALQALLVQVYHEHPSLAQICERFVDLDEGFAEWRYRHVQMVQRTIGIKLGTGGSPGAEYLKRTLFTPFFPDLWAIRGLL